MEVAKLIRFGQQEMQVDLSILNMSTMSRVSALSSTCFREDFIDDDEEEDINLPQNNSVLHSTINTVVAEPLVLSPISHLSLFVKRKQFFSTTKLSTLLLRESL